MAADASDAERGVGPFGCGGFGGAVGGGRLGQRQQGKGVGEGLASRRARGRPARAPNPAALCRECTSRETCITRQHRRQIRALSYYACSSCIARQASPSAPDCRACRFLDGCDGAVPRPRGPVGSVKAAGRGRWVRAPAGKVSSRRLCQAGVRECHGKPAKTTTPAPGPSPVVLTMLFMHNTTGLAIWRKIVVLCRFRKGAMAPAPLANRQRHRAPATAATPSGRPAGDDLARRPVGQRHDRDHRVDPGRGRERRAVADPNARRVVQLAASVGDRVLGSEPIRHEPIWCAVKTAMSLACSDPCWISAGTPRSPHPRASDTGSSARA